MLYCSQAKKAQWWINLHCSKSCTNTKQRHPPAWRTYSHAVLPKKVLSFTQAAWSPLVPAPTHALVLPGKIKQMLLANIYMARSGFVCLFICFFMRCIHAALPFNARLYFIWVIYIYILIGSVYQWPLCKGCVDWSFSALKCSTYKAIGGTSAFQKKKNNSPRYDATLKW